MCVWRRFTKPKSDFSYTIARRAVGCATVSSIERCGGHRKNGRASFMNGRHENLSLRNTGRIREMVERDYEDANIPFNRI